VLRGAAPRARKASKRIPASCDAGPLVRSLLALAIPALAERQGCWAHPVFNSSDARASASICDLPPGLDGGGAHSVSIIIDACGDRTVVMEGPPYP
jgi:hypothetical protein